MLTERIRENFGIRGRIVAASLLPVLLISLLLVVYYIYNWIDDANKRITHNGERYSVELAKLSEFALFTGDIGFLSVLSKSLFSDPDVYSVRILNNKNEVLTEVVSPRYVDSDPDDINTNGFVYISNVLTGQLSTIDFDEYFNAIDSSPYPDLLGRIEVVMTDNYALSKRSELLLHTLYMLMIVFIGAFLLAIYFSGQITRPLQNMKTWVNKIANGESVDGIVRNTGTSSELGELEEAFYAMALAVNNSQFELQKKIDIATAKHKDMIDHLEASNLELEKARESMQSAIAEKTEFLARMSHEIRTPIHSITGFVNLIKRTSLDNTQSEFVRIVEHASDHLLQLINDILDISSLERKSIKLEEEAFNLRDCIEDVTLLMSPAAHNKGLEIVHLIDSDVPIYLIGDPYYIKQIIMNLVNNAIKFTDSGEVIITVSLLDDGLDTTRLSICVADTGRGIAAEDIELIQQPFYQTDVSRSREHEGVGLGLAIVKTLATLMNGQLSIDSILNSGTRVKCILTLKKQVDVPETKYPDNFSDKKILCFDNHPLALRSIRNQLLLWTSQVFTTSNLDRVLDMLKNAVDDGHPFDLFVAGVNKETSASECWRSQMQTIKSTTGIKMMILLGDEDQQKCTLLSSGKDCLCITKPVAHAYLYASLKTILSGTDSDWRTHSSKVPESAPDIAEAKPLDARILLAEDNQFNRLYVSTLLKDRGFTVTEADTGQAAVRLAAEQKFNLIVMDIHLPEMDGLAASRKIRTESTLNSDTTIIALTADVYINKQARLKENGIDDYITKPVKEDEFWRMIDKYLPPGMMAGEDGQHYAPDADGKCFRVAKNSGADGIKQQLFPRLIEELPEHSSRIHAAFISGNREDLVEHLHQLKGIAGYFKLADLSAIASQADQFVRNVEAEKLIEARSLIQRIDEKIQEILGNALL